MLRASTLAAAVALLAASPMTAEEAKPFPLPRMTPKRTDVKPFEYVDVGKKIPNYTPSRTWGIQGEPLSKMQKPLTAEESLKRMQDFAKRKQQFIAVVRRANSN